MRTMLKDTGKNHDSKYTILIIDTEWQYSTKMTEYPALVWADAETETLHLECCLIHDDNSSICSNDVLITM